MLEVEQIVKIVLPITLALIVFILTKDKQHI